MKPWLPLLLAVLYCAKPVEDPVPLVLIHGIKGSLLEDAEGQTAWLSGREAMGWKHYRLSLPTEWKGEEQKRDGLRATGILKEVYVVPFLIGEKVYGPFIKGADKLDRPFYTFAYDWRRDNIENLRLFTAFLKEVSEKNRNAKVQVVAHSMGGLITRAALAENPELFHSVVFAGVPFSGGLGFLPDMHAGEPVGRNERILSPEVYFTFPSVYTLFQEGSSRIYESGKELPINLYNADDWAKYKLGLFSLELVSPSQAAHLRMCLKRGKEFRRLVSLPVSKNIPVYVVLSKSTPTLATVERNGPKSVRGYDFESRPREPGDGRVREADAFPPGLKSETLYSEKVHSELLNDAAVMDLVRKTGEKK